MDVPADPAPCAELPADIQADIRERESKWIWPGLQRRVRLGRLIYPEPQGWPCEEDSSPAGGAYYYPYGDDKAQLWISRKRLPGNGDPVDYRAMANGLAKGSDNVISITDAAIGSVRGKKIHHYLPIDDRLFENDSYFFPYEGKLYGILFGEENALTGNMEQFEKEFLGLCEFEGARRGDGSSSGRTIAPQRRAVRRESYLD